LDAAHGAGRHFGRRQGHSQLPEIINIIPILAKLLNYADYGVKIIILYTVHSGIIIIRYTGTYTDNIVPLM